jgi:hypothetical protein
MQPAHFLASKAPVGRERSPAMAVAETTVVETNPVGIGFMGPIGQYRGDRI